MPEDVPFFPNTKDNTRCMEACMRMALKYYYPDKNFSYKKLDKLIKKKKGKWLWVCQGLAVLSKLGLDCIMYSKTDYKKLARNVEKYVKEKFKNDKEKILKVTDKTEAKKSAKIIVKNKLHRMKRLTEKQLQVKLDKGSFLILLINSRVLKNRKGYGGHFVVLLKMTKDYVVIHDPGKTPRPNRRIRKDHFFKAWRYPVAGRSTIEIRGIKKSHSGLC